MKHNVSWVVEHGLCTSCGVCAGSCPKKCITFHYGKDQNVPQVDVKDCINCGLCYEVCPGKGIDLNQWSKILFGDTKDVKVNSFAGHYINTYVGHSTNQKIRLHSATGGMVTQFLIWLLNNKEIDGAIVVRYSKDNPLEPEPFIATKECELWESHSSKYVVVSMDKVARKIADGKYKRLVVVGLPCHIQGWRQLAKKNKIVRETIVGYFAIYCSVNKTKHSIYYYPKRYRVPVKQIAKFAFRDDGCMGFMKFENKDGKILKKVPYLSYWFGTHSFFANSRCSLCIDQLGELADVSFGDIHIEPYSNDHVGTNSIVARSDRWDMLLNQCYEEGFVTLDKIDVTTLVSSQIYTRTFKKGAGVKTNMMLRKMVGKCNPMYDYHYTGNITLKDILSEMAKALMRKIGKHQQLWWIVRLCDRNKD